MLETSAQTPPRWFIMEVFTPLVPWIATNMRINSPDNKPKRPPNYQSRGMQWRILAGILIGYLVLQIGSMVFFPDQWQWLLAPTPKPEALQAEAVQGGDMTSDIEAIAPAAVLDLSGVEDAQAVERAWRLGWAESWAEFSHDDKAALIDLLESAERKESLTGDRLAAAANAVRHLEREWTAYRERAETSLTKLPKSERSAWFPVLEQLDYQWGQVAHPALAAASRGDALDDQQQVACARSLALLDQHMWSTVEDSSMWRPAEREVWHRAILAARNADAAATSGDPAPLVGYVPLNNYPEKYRGRVLRVRGIVQALYSTSAGSNPYGIDKYWVYVLWPYGGTNSPLIVYALEKPDGLPSITFEELGKKRMPSQEEVVFTGVFFKRLAYRSVGGFDAAPLVVAVRPQWTPSRPTDAKPISWFFLLPTILALAVLATALAVFVYRAYPPGNPFRDSKAASSTATLVLALVLGFSGKVSVAQAPAGEEAKPQETPVASDPSETSDEPDESPKTTIIEERPDPTAGPLPWERGAKSVVGQERTLPPREFFDLLGFDFSNWRNFLPDIPLGPTDNSPLARLMFLADRLNEPLLDQWLDRGASWEKLLAEPLASQTEVLPLKGICQRIEKLEVLPELQRRYELKHFYRVDLVDGSSESQSAACILFVREVPKELFDGKSSVVELRERVGCSALFVKRVMPEGEPPGFVFVSRRLRWYPESSSTRLADPQSHGQLAQQGFDIGLLDRIQERNGHTLDDGDGDMEAFYGMMAAANRIGKSGTPPKATELNLSTALSKPAQLAGRYVAVRGAARRITEIRDLSPAVRRWLGTDRYYEIDMAMGVDSTITIKKDRDDTTPLRFGHEYPLTICATELPAGLKPSDRMFEHIEIEGFFYRLWAYDTDFATEAKRKQVSPLLHAARIAVVKPPAHSESLASIFVSIAIVAGMGGFAFWYWRMQRADLAHSRRLRHREGDRPIVLDPQLLENQSGE